MLYSQKRASLHARCGPHWHARHIRLPPRTVSIVLALVLATCTVILAVGRDEDGKRLTLPHGDANYHYIYLPTVWLDFDVDFTNQYAVAGDPWKHRTTPTGRPGNVFGIGAAVFESPSFVVGHAIARITGQRADGFSSVELFLVAWASVLATLGALYLAYRLLARRLGDDRLAIAGATIALAAGPALFYAVRQPGMTHPFAMLFATWLLDAWDASYAEERTARTWAKLGALLGFTILARPQLVTWGLCLAAAGIADLWSARRTHTLPRALGRLAIGVAAMLLCLLPQLVTWKVNYGSFFVIPQGDGFMRWSETAWAETLFSSRNGLLPWSPLYVLALVGLGLAVRRASRLVIALVVGLALQAVVNGAVWDWWAGGSFGARRFDSTYLVWALGLGTLLAACRRKHLAAFVACVAVCAWLAIANVVLALGTTPHSMRMKGGEPAADVFERELGAFGAPVGWLSSLANLPARAVFAIRHDTDLGAYDRVVGSHWLGELYPELSWRTVKLLERRDVAKLPAAVRAGFRGSSDELAAGTARVLIPLNRIGPVHVRVAATATSGGTLSVAWNGRELTSAPLGPGETVVEFVATELERGVNTLTVRAPPGTRVPWIELRSDPGVH